MMQTALRIQRVNDAGIPYATVDFLENEVLECIPAPFHKTRIDRAQSGRPTQQLFRSDWMMIPVKVRIQDDATQDKIAGLRNAATVATRFRVFPNMIDNPSESFDCFMSPDAIIRHLFSGRLVVGGTDTLTFLERSYS